MSQRTLKVRGSEEWIRWLQDLADHCHCTASTAVEQALWRYAEGVGFNHPPPHRNPATWRREPTSAAQIRAEEGRYRGDRPGDDHQEEPADVEED